MKLALFFTRAVSLGLWVESGLFEREKLVYEKYLNDGLIAKMVWLTYGAGDREVADSLYMDGRLDRRIEILPMPFLFCIPRVGSWLYSLVMPLVHRTSLRSVDVLKTNQLDGGWAALLSRFAFDKPLLLRCGYVQSKVELALGRRSWLRLRLMLWLEALMYRFADIAVVSSIKNQRYVREHFFIPGENVHVVPTYVDINGFAPNPTTFSSSYKRRFVFVGRFSKEKNLLNLVKAVARLDIGLDIVGEGPCKAEVVELADKLGADVQLLGKIPNQQLPAILNSYHYFALPSFTEGMPKSLLEAMACGLVCVGTDVDGINEVIIDGVNGFLSRGTDANALCLAIQRAFDADAESISAAARQTVLTGYTVDAYARAEAKLLVSLVK